MYTYRRARVSSWAWRTLKTEGHQLVKCLQFTLQFLMAVTRTSLFPAKILQIFDILQYPLPQTLLETGHSSVSSISQFRVHLSVPGPVLLYLLFLPLVPELSVTPNAQVHIMFPVWTVTHPTALYLLEATALFK